MLLNMQNSNELRRWKHLKVLELGQNGPVLILLNGPLP